MASKKRIILVFLVLLSIISVNALNFKGSDNLKLCVILTNGTRTCLNNTNEAGINVSDMDITLELYHLKKEKSYNTIHDFFFTNIIDILFVLLCVFFLVYFVYSLLK